MRKLFGFVLLLAFLGSLAGCRPKEPDLSQEINVALIGTLAARPTSTLPPMPTLIPTPTVFEISGLFCEYSFCIGHPADLSFFDARSQNDPTFHSEYGSGRVAGFRDNLFILTAWVQSSGAWDPQGITKVLTDEFGVAQTGEMQEELAGDLNIAWQQVAAPANSVFKNGFIATWRCGNRDFIWLAFSVNENEGPPLLKEAINKFQCIQ